jgi:hypothetical protein
MMLSKKSLESVMQGPVLDGCVIRAVSAKPSTPTDTTADSRQSNAGCVLDEEWREKTRKDSERLGKGPGMKRYLQPNPSSRLDPRESRVLHS